MPNNSDRRALNFGGNHCMDGGNYSMDGVLQGKLFYGTNETRTLWSPVGWGLAVGDWGLHPSTNQPTNQPAQPVYSAGPLAGQSAAARS